MYRVVVVDDTDDLRMYLSCALKHFGMSVTEASSGKEAVRLILAERPDVALIDLRMPDLSGDKVAQEVRRQGFRGALIAVTGCAFSFELDPIRGFFDRIVTKPVGLPELREAVMAEVARIKPPGGNTHEHAVN